MKANTAVLVALLAASCASAETPGDRFRQKMLERQKYCDKHELRPGETTCDILKLRAADPLATPEGRFAHSIKLPPKADSAKDRYRVGMSSEEYFKALCEEAGEFVFNRVNDVEGIMQMRPRSVATDDMLQHLYALEDPYGYRDWEARRPEFFYSNPKAYKFVEMPADGENPIGRVVRYFGYDGRDPATMKKEISPAPKSRYGFLWRGIVRPNDRELGIAGGELIVLDIHTRQVLGVKRGFARTGDVKPVPLGIWWRAPSVCQADSDAAYALAQFVTKVLIPVQR